MRFAEKTCQAGAEHPVEAFLGDEAGTEKDYDVRTNVPQTSKGFFAIHERHGEVEQNQIEMARTLAEKIQALKARLGGHDFESGVHEHAFGENERHRLIVDDQKRSPLFFRRRHGGISWFGEGSQLRMEQDFFVGATGVLDQLRRHLGRAIHAGAKHIEILLRPVIALPDVLDGRAGARNDFQQIVQLACGGSGRLGRDGTLGRVVVHDEGFGCALGTLSTPSPGKDYLPPLKQEKCRQEPAGRAGRSRSAAGRHPGRTSAGNRRSQTGANWLYFRSREMNQLSISNLRVSIADQEIIRGLSLAVPKGEVHAIMGPNGSGKSTLAKVLAGHPDYKVTAGEVLMDGENILELAPDERARKGLFLAFQYPSEIPGVTIANFLRAAVQARLPEGEELEATDYYARLYEKMDLLEMDRSFTSRSVNEGFSGGEKKRNEILQLAMLEPRYAVLDETDSGLDIDALKVVSHGVNSMRGPDRGILVITHYQRLLDYIVPDHVHVMVQGRIVRSGGKELALELEEKGYESYEEVKDGVSEPAMA
jgi:Fe-S cluster assembly ATP-binding protein